MIHSPARSRKSGFTLLELVIAVGLLAILVGMVFGTARTSLALGNRIVESQNEEMLHQAFFDLLGQRFSALPGNTRFDLKVSDSGSHYISDLTLQNVPLSFTWGGETKIAKAVQLSTVKRRSGYLDIVLRYYDEEILEDSASTVQTKNSASNKPTEIILLTDVAFFEWRVLDGRSMEWQYDWDLQGRLPLQLELTMAIGAKGEEIRRVFWLPPKMSPEVRMRNLGNNANGGNNNLNPGGGGGRGRDGNDGGGRGGPGGGGGGGGRGPGGGGGGAQPPTIQIPRN